MNLPEAVFLSAPLWLITTLHIVTLTLHFVAMNLLVGGTIFVLWAAGAGRLGNPVVGRVIVLLPATMAATVTLGVAPLLFVQLVYHRQVYAASIVSGWLWLGIVGAAIAAYYLLYAAAFCKPPSPGRHGTFFGLALVALLYVSFVYSTVFSMAERPDLIAALYAQSQSGLAINPQAGEWLPRWLHMLTGAVGVGGFILGILARDDEQAWSMARALFLGGMALAATFGILYLAVLGREIGPFMRTPGAWTLTVGIVLFLGALHFFFKKRFVPAGAMLFVSLLSMVLNRHYLRLVRLEAHYDPASLPVAPQWSPFVLFLVCFVLALALVGYMLYLFFADRKEAA